MTADANAMAMRTSAIMVMFPVCIAEWVVEIGEKCAFSIATEKVSEDMNEPVEYSYRPSPL